MTNSYFTQRQLTALCFCFFVLITLFSDMAVARRLRPSADEAIVTRVDNPRLHNPIDLFEKNRGKSIAEGAETIVRAKQNAAVRRKPRGLESLDNVQALYVEHHDEGKNADPRSRKADVTYYDYAKNKAIKVVVDLNTNSPIETTVKQGSENQPYFSHAELNAAMQLIFNHPQLGSVLRKAYLEVTGNTLNDVSVLDAQGGVYFPDQGSGLGRLAASCQIDRCMQLFIPIDDTHFLDATNVVVNLSSGEVLWVRGGITGHAHSH